MPQVRRGLVVVATLAAIGAGALTAGTVGMVSAAGPVERPPASAGVGADGEPVLDRRVPEGYRLVGHGRLALAVPEEWATDAVTCNGEPVADTVVNPMYVFCAMATSTVPNVTAVELGQPSQPDATTHGSAPSAQTSPVALRREPVECDDGLGEAVVCRAVVTDGAGSALTVRSTITDRAAAVAAVDQLADAVVLLDQEEVVVPSAFAHDVYAESSSEAYREQLEIAGLEVDVVEVRRLPASAGRFVAVEPAVSTVLPRGATVRLEVEAPPATFVDGIRLDGNHTGNLGGADEALSDERIRAGARLSLTVGESFWLFAEPVAWSQEQADAGWASTRASGRIATGTSVERVNEDRVEVAQWAAVRPGTSTVVMTVLDDDGVEHDAGTVTIEVTD